MARKQTALQDIFYFKTHTEGWQFESLEAKHGGKCS